MPKWVTVYDMLDLDNVLRHDLSKSLVVERGRWVSMYTSYYSRRNSNCLWHWWHVFAFSIDLIIIISCHLFTSELLMNTHYLEITHWSADHLLSCNHLLSFRYSLRGRLLVLNHIVLPCALISSQWPAMLVRISLSNAIEVTIKCYALILGDWTIVERVRWISFS